MPIGLSAKSSYNPCMDKYGRADTGIHVASAMRPDETQVCLVCMIRLPEDVRVSPGDQIAFSPVCGPYRPTLLRKRKGGADAQVKPAEVLTAAGPAPADVIAGP